MLALEVLPVARVDRLGDRDQAERGLDVAAGLDPPARERDRDVLLALEVLVGGLGGHRHLDLGLPVDLVGPLPVQVAALPVLGGADVDHEVEVGELEALRDVGVAQLRAHLGIGVHHREDLVDDLDELVLRVELDLRHQLPPDGVAGAAGAAACFFSSSATRLESASISARRPRTSSSTRRSSKLSRIRCAADATSSSRLRPRSRAPSVEPVVAWKVRSTAPRTASTTSAGSRLLSFLAVASFFLSFL